MPFWFVTVRVLVVYMYCTWQARRQQHAREYIQRVTSLKAVRWQWWCQRLPWMDHKLGPMGKRYIILLRVCGTIIHPHIHTLKHHLRVAEQQVLPHTLSHLSVQPNKFPAGQRASRCRIQMSCITDLTDVNKQQHSTATLCWIILVDHLKLLEIITWLVHQILRTLNSKNKSYHAYLSF